MKENSRKKLSIAQHDERCGKCKETVKKLLEKIYGKVEQNYKFKIGTQPDDFKNTPYYDKLKEIYEALQSHRGFKEFVKAKTLPNCDFFISKPGFIVEFDETQHFTEPRRIALENYPKKLELGFDRERWIELCKRIKAKDNGPFYRDEQRAWYDTLRDFIPIIKNLNPTVRLFAKDCVWCCLSPKNSSDVKRFENILKGTSERWEIEVRKEQGPSIARVIIAGEWEGNSIKAKQLLEDVCKKWPKGGKVKFLITCGGFIQFGWPESIFPNDLGNNKNPNDKAMNKLIAKAKECINSVLNKDLCRKLSEVTDYITLGVDSFKEKISESEAALDIVKMESIDSFKKKISTTKNINQPHIELVFLKDLRQDKLYWTGKSYPTIAQEKNLIRIADLETHFLDLDIGKVMILGCHDLTIFNPRSKNAKNWRRDVNDEFKKLTEKKKPIYVLQHPHTTVKKRTWLNAWSGLRKTLPYVYVQYAGAGRYHESDRECSKWDDLETVLKDTKNTFTIDFICREIN